VQNAKGIYPILGISCGGDENKLLGLLAILEEEQQALVSHFKPNNRRELKNLKCSINFDARGFSM
jgi:hypothetical protein